jgi:hypothetical protein
MDNIEKLRQIKKDKRDAVFKKPNVVGLSVGYKEIQGILTDTPCIKVFVSKKIDKKKIKKSDLIPESIDGEMTDVIESMPEALDVRTSKQRPAFGGISIGHPSITAGTLGCLINTGGSNYIISNNHVLAAVNTATIGDYIYQPGVYDGGTASDIIGRLTKFVPITLYENIVEDPTVNYVDGALCLPTTQSLVNNTIYEVGTYSGLVVEPYLGQTVTKSGRTTGVSVGTVSSIDFEGWVSYSTHGYGYFVDQIQVSATVAGGDSGSAVLDSSMGFVGLLFAGGGGYYVASKSGQVFTRLIYGNFSQSSMDSIIGGLVQTNTMDAFIGTYNMTVITQYMSGFNIDTYTALRSIVRDSSGTLWYADKLGRGAVGGTWGIVRVFNSVDNGVTWSYENLAVPVFPSGEGIGNFFYNPHIITNGLDIYVVAYGWILPHYNTYPVDYGIYGFYRNHTTGVWSGPEAVALASEIGISTFGSYTIEPAAIYDEFDNIHFVWSNLGTIPFYRKKSSSGVFSAIEIPSVTYKVPGAFFNSVAPLIFMDKITRDIYLVMPGCIYPNSTPFVIYCFVKDYITNQWSTEVVDSYLTNISFWSSCMDSDNTIHVVYGGSKGNPYLDIYYTKRTTSAGWSTPIKLVTNTTGDVFDADSISSDINNNLYVLYNSRSGELPDTTKPTLHLIRCVSNVWQSPEIIIDSSVGGHRGRLIHQNTPNNYNLTKSGYYGSAEDRIDSGTMTGYSIMAIPDSAIFTSQTTNYTKIVAAPLIFLNRMVRKIAGKRIENIRLILTRVLSKHTKKNAEFLVGVLSFYNLLTKKDKNSPEEFIRNFIISMKVILNDISINEIASFIVGVIVNQVKKRTSGKLITKQISLSKNIQSSHGFIRSILLQLKTKSLETKLMAISKTILTRIYMTNTRLIKFISKLIRISIYTRNDLDFDNKNIKRFRVTGFISSKINRSVNLSSIYKPPIIFSSVKRLNWPTSVLITLLFTSGSRLIYLYIKGRFISVSIYLNSSMDRFSAI